MSTSTTQRLPFPYRREADVVGHRLQSLHDALDWPAVVRVARPWVEAVRKHPPPFWAMESLLKEYPISSAEGLALMRWPKRCCACPMRRPRSHSPPTSWAVPISRAPPTGCCRASRTRRLRCARSSCPALRRRRANGRQRPARQAWRAHRRGGDAARGAVAGAAVRPGPGHGRSVARGGFRAAQHEGPALLVRHAGRRRAH